jgi:hypothetical protein
MLSSGLIPRAQRENDYLLLYNGKVKNTWSLSSIHLHVLIRMDEDKMIACAHKSNLANNTAGRGWAKLTMDIRNVILQRSQI